MNTFEEVEMETFEVPIDSCESLDDTKDIEDQTERNKNGPINKRRTKK